MRNRHLLICIVLLAGAIVAGCNRDRNRKQQPSIHPQAMHVRVGPVIRDTIPLPLFFPGKLAAAAEMKLGFKTGGIIRGINAVEGANVARGAHIALLDTIELAAWRDKARTALEKATRDFARAQQLFNDSAVTLELLQNARSALSAAQADSAIASFNLSQAILTAPTAGKILKRLAEKNEIIGPGMPVVIFASTEGGWSIKAAVPDRDLPVISTGDRATIVFDALPHNEFSARLVRIAGAADPVTGTFEIELALDREDPGFRPGLVADVRLFPRQQERLYFIPAAALVEGSGDTGTVFAVDGKNAITPVTVTIARMYGNMMAVSRGLENIDAVITAGAQYVRSSSAEHIIVDRDREQVPCSR